MLTLNKIKTFKDFIEEIGENYGKKTALIWRPKFRALKFSYEELHRLSRVVAHFLEKEDIKKGERVVIWLGNSPWWVAIFFGCQLKGVIAVPLAAQNTPEFVKKITEFTKAKLIFKNQRLPILPEPIKTVIVEDFFDNWQEKPTSHEEAEISSNDIAEILFTSGTTGEPKGAELRHRNILSNVKTLKSLGLVNSTDRMISVLPLSHIFEQVTGLFLPLSFGIQITQAVYLSGLHITMNMAEDHPTAMITVPEFLCLTIKRIEEKAKHEGADKKLEFLYKISPYLPMKLRRVLAKEILRAFGKKLSLIASGGAALDPEVGKKWEAFGIYVLQGYGATETSPVVSVNRFKGRKLESVGPLIPGVEVKIADDGEIIVKGPNVIDGYYKNPEKTAAAFKDGWYYTDDLGFIDKDGHLHILGRKKYLIVTPAGENVYPEDIETILNQEPAVADSAVLGIKEKDRFEIHAVLLPKIDMPFDASSIIESVNKKLEPHQKIQGFSIWDQPDFPRTVTKKIKKEEVIEWLKERQVGAKPTAVIETFGPVERILSEISGIPAPEITAKKRLISDLKMDSLARVAFVSAVEEDLNIILDESAIDEKTTVADIKEKISKKEQKEERYPFLEWPFHPWICCLRVCCQFLIWPLIFVSSRFKILGRENIKKIKGPTLFFMNHISLIDSLFLIRALPLSLRKKLATAAASDILFEDPKFRKFISVLTFLFNIYPFSRYGQIKSSLEYSGRLIDRGFSVSLFPEGQISPTGELRPIKEGASLMASEMNVPVVPVFISGTNILLPYGTKKLFWRKRPEITVVFGTPLIFSRKDSRIYVTQVLETALKNLKSAALSGNNFLDYSNSVFDNFSPSNFV